MYFGLGTRSVNKLYVPQNYDFVPLLRALNEVSQPIADHNQYLNNLDYQKAIRLMSSKYYMDAGTFLLVEDDGTEPALPSYSTRTVTDSPAPQITKSQFPRNAGFRSGKRTSPP